MVLRNIRCCICEWLIGLALDIAPKDYLPSIVEAAERLGRLAYENDYRHDNGIPPAKLVT